ncbi:hypothetical protein [Neolewinella persica]|uniref:hypothetical protein n=1 Tax=Neolewinella persica TaxID=70998 RepID=UPI0003696EAC|nr:hypothetical protein [Neolewinella persica]
MTRFIVLCLVFLMTGCTSPNVGPPPVDLDKLAPVMAELQIAEALATEVPVLIRDSIKQVYFNRVLEDYDMNEASFDSLTWLVRQEPIWIDSLYTKIGVLLAKLEVDRAQ